MEFFSESDVKRSETFSNRCFKRTFQTVSVASNSVHRLLRNQVTVCSLAFSVYLVIFPFDWDISGFEDIDDALRDFRANTISWEKDDFSFGRFGEKEFRLMFKEVSRHGGGDEHNR